MQEEFRNKSYTKLEFFRNWAILAIAVAMASLLVDIFTGFPLFHYVIIVIFFLTLLIILRIVQLIYKRIEEKRYDFKQMEALVGLYHHLNPGVQLPATRIHAGSPDFLKLLVDLLEKHQPACIVEAGSGISSIVISEWLKQHAPNTKHYALDHEEKYARLTREKIHFEGTQIIHAPIVTHHLNNQAYLWYDLQQLPKDQKIDFLVIDGPPAPLAKHARYPALPLLTDQLSSNAIILLDDGIRQDEKETVDQWAGLASFQKRYLPLEKGAFVLTLD